MSTTKILVLKRKQIFLVCATILALLALILFLCIFFGNKKPSSAETIAGYTAGVYQKELTLGDYEMTLTVTVDGGKIRDAALIYLTDAIETMYPLLADAMTHINEALDSGTALSEITPEATLRYTESYLLNAIEDAVTVD